MVSEIVLILFAIIGVFLLIRNMLVYDFIKKQSEIVEYSNTERMKYLVNQHQREKALFDNMELIEIFEEKINDQVKLLFSFKKLKVENFLTEEEYQRYKELIIVSP